MIPHQFDWGGTFRHGVALVGTGREVAAIERSGRTVWEPRLPVATGETIPFEMLADVRSDLYSTARRFEVLRDARTFALRWSELVSKKRPPPPPPTVDFSRTVVLLVAAGEKPTTGYAVSVRRIVKTEGGLVVFVDEQRPGMQLCAVGQAYTAPTLLITIPRTELPVTFATQVRHFCGRPGR